MLEGPATVPGEIPAAYESLGGPAGWLAEEENGKEKGFRRGR
jgi:uncharacterized protein with LGFP repeats